MTLSGAGRRRKGADAERALANFLSDRLGRVVRRNVDRRVDTGDLLGVGSVGVECKNCARLDLSGWLRQAQEGAERAGLSMGVVVVKRRGTADPGGWYAVMSVADLCELIREHGVEEVA